MTKRSPRIDCATKACHRAAILALTAWIGVTGLAAFLLPPSVAAQPAQPAPAAPNPAAAVLLAIKAWHVRGEADSVVYRSPAGPGEASMTVTLPLGEAIGGQPLEDWFEKRVAALVPALAAGRAIHKRQGASKRATPSGVVMTDGVSFKTAEGKGGDLVLLTGWAAPGGAQIAIETIPAAMPDGHPRIRESSDYVAVLSSLRFELTPDKLDLQRKNNR